MSESGRPELDREQQEQARELFGELLELGDDERQSRLASIDDRAVAEEVASLLGQLTEDDSFLAEPLLGRLAEPGRSEEELNEVVGRFTRFTDLERIAAGGMGVVFRGFDPRVERSVAIKFLRPTGLDVGALGEARAQDRVRHEAILPVFEADVFEEYRYIVMPFVDGPALLELSDAPVEEKAKLMKRVAEGLDAAHRVDLVHRDVKPSNILVERGETGLRPYLADFGIVAPRGPVAEGPLVGSPWYMAPEKLSVGRSVDEVRADIWSLGATFYELFAGQRPYPGETTDEILELARDEPRPLIELAPEVPEALSQIVMRCLALDPADRFPSARAVAEELARQIEKVEPIGVGRRLRGVAAIALAGLVAFWAYEAPLDQVATEPEISEPAPEIVNRPLLAIPTPTNATRRAEFDWLPGVMAEAFADGLADGGRRVVRDDATRRISWSLGPVSLGDDWLEHHRTQMAARYGSGGWMVLAAVEPNGKGLRLVARVVELIPSRELTRAEVEFDPADWWEAVAESIDQLRSGLGWEPVDTESLRRRLPGDAGAVTSWGWGLDRLAIGDARQAARRFERAVELEPDHPVAHVGLAAALFQLGDRAGSAAALEAAVERSQPLTVGRRLALDGRLRQRQGDFEQATVLYRSWWEGVPDDPAPGLALVDALVESGAVEEALAVISELKRRQAAGLVEPELLYVESRAVNATGDVERARELSAEAACLAERTGDDWLVAEAKQVETWALRSAGQLALALETAAESVRLASRVGDLKVEADAVLTEGLVVEIAGRADQALAAYDRAIELYVAVGDRRNEGVALLNKANVIRRRGEMGMAHRLYQQVLTIALETGDRRSEAMTRSTLGAMLERAGEIDAALDSYERALASFREIGDRRGIASQLRRLGAVAQARGRLGEARDRWNEALELWREMGNPAGVSVLLADLGHVHRLLGDVTTAEKMLDESESLVRELGIPIGIANALERRSLVALSRAEPALAREQLLEALSFQDQTRESVAALGVVAELAWVETVAGNADAIRARLDELTERAAALGVDLSGSEVDRIRRAVQARIAMVEGRWSDAVDGFASIVGDDRRSGRAEGEAAARVDLARALAEVGRLDDAVAELALAEPLAGRLENRLLVDLVAIAGAEIRGLAAIAAGRTPDEELELLASMAIDLAESDRRLDSLECRVARVRLERAAGIESADEAELIAELEDRGIGLLLRRLAVVQPSS